jgi:mitochondrial fission protein ELM1
MRLTGKGRSLISAPMNGTGESPAIWVLTDDRAGNVAQALGVAEALGLPFSEKPIRYTPFGRLHNLLRAASRRGLVLWSRKSIEQMPPPGLVIAAGRRTAPLARWFKRRFGANLVQVMDPGWPGRGQFDLIAAPLHDDLPDAFNVIHTLGSCHRASPQKLAAEAEAWRDRIPDLPRPWTFLAVGGAAAGTPFGAAEAALLAEQVTAMPGSLLVLTSRRTGPIAEAMLREALPQAGYFRPWREEGDNPYFGLLALSDRIVVTGDSMSMCSEACANGGPVFIFAPPSLKDPKFRALHTQLYERGYAKPLGSDAGMWRHAPLNSARMVADEILRRGLI